MDALTIASGNAKEIIGRGLTDAITSAFGGGDINKATTNIEKMGQVVADIVTGLGTMVGFLGKIGSWSARNSNKAIAARDPKNRTPYDPMSAITPGLSPEFMKNLKERKKADDEAAKRSKALAALLLKNAKEQAKLTKEQTALAKAKAVLDKASSVMNMDLIQNTAALMGRVTADETLRLKLQQAILLGNSEQAGNLAQQLLSSQIAAMKLSSSNPLGGFTDALQAALKALQQIRAELALLGAPKVPVLSSLIATSGYDPGSQGGQGTPGTTFPDYNEPMYNYQDAFTRLNPRTGAPMNVVVSIDPSAAQYGISAAVVANAANGNSNSFQRTGTGF
jgi:hypothetical protein